MSSFDAFFRQATTHPPYGYQARLARGGLPAVVQVPTGAGKTGIILAWLWRRLHGPDRAATPRRLIFALPQRTLVEPVVAVARTWVGNLGLAERVAVHAVPDGAGDTQRFLRLDLHRPAIVVGTMDALVSKALNRGYGVSRAGYPIDFALVTNGAHWVIDEDQLAPRSTATLRRLATFNHGTRPTAEEHAAWPTAEPFGLTRMSATAAPRTPATADDSPPDGDDPLAEGDGPLRIARGERTGELAVRLAAARTLRRAAVEPGDHRGLAAAVRERHRPGGRTVVVLNTVAAARDVYAALRGGPTPCTLLHSRFRAVDRQPLIARLLAEPGPDGRIIVATRVIEAAVDVDAAVLFMEAAPWPAVVQRAGRCNRHGRWSDAELWWLPPAGPAPYAGTDVRVSVALLETLEGRALTGEELGDLAPPRSAAPPEATVLRRADLRALFDTATEPGDGELDVGPYLRDTGDLDVELAWARWTPVDGTGRPPAAGRSPEPAWRCRVPLGELRALVERADAWRYDQVARDWARITGQRPARPGELLLLAAGAGGYDVETGFDASVRRAVPDCPPLAVPADPGSRTEPAPEGEDPPGAVAADGWLSLERHGEDVRDQVRALVTAAGPGLPAEVLRAVEVAAHAHDAGKCHPLWQDALCRLAPEREQARVQAGRPWAKSGVDRPLDLPPGVNFRHELVSMLLLDGPLRGLSDGIVDRDLVRYLALAHHGQLRLRVGGPDDAGTTLLGLDQHEVVRVPAMLGQPAGELTVDLDQFNGGDEGAWTRTATGLRDRYGPFVLAYLETLVRIADWRASAGLPPAA